jgi:4-hydroxymandelate oxidase
MTAMYRAGPSVRGDDGRGPLVLRSVRSRVFAGASPLAADPGHTARHEVYLTDLLRPYGLKPDDVGDGRGQSFGEMAAVVIAEAVTPDQPVDLLVLAFAGPDITPGRATATYLSHLCPGGPLAFAICDQGSAAAFTGLRLIDDYTRTGPARSALLVVVEQADLHHEPAAAVTLPARHTAVALRTERGTGPGAVTLRQHADVPPAQVDGLLAAELGATGPGDVPVLLSASLAAAGGHGQVVPAGQPLTGIWSALADSPGEHRTLLADYDPDLRYLSLCTIGTSC